MSLTTTFLIRGVGSDAGEAQAWLTKRLALPATIAGALYGGDFDAAPVTVPGTADFRHFSVRLTPVTGCCRLLISISTAWAQPVSFENLLWRSWATSAASVAHVNDAR